MDDEWSLGRHDNGTIKRKPLPMSSGPLPSIPRLKKIKRDLLTDLPLSSHECQHDILASVRKSFHYAYSSACHEFVKVQSVYNSELSTKYLERRREMKSSGYPDSLLAENLAFIPVDNSLVAQQMSREGVKCGNQLFSGLGVSHLAVHVCKHADVVTSNRPKPGKKILLVVKVIKGKVKTVVCKSGVKLEPTPNYDCHAAKPVTDPTTILPPHMLLLTTQLYLYEYGDFEISQYPRQILPYAVVYYLLKEPLAALPKPVTSLPVNVAPPTSGLTPALPNQESGGPGNEVWRGQLLVKLVTGGPISINVSMLSYFVPLTVNLLSPIVIQDLYPEHNAQFTFFSGLSNIATKDEVEWRAHYFKSFTMRPRTNNENLFKALIKHITSKREMPTVRLANDVFLFMMPDCLLASQLGLVRRDEDLPNLHCVLMSKFSTTEAQKKNLVKKNCELKNFGSATSYENLFDDSDFTDDEEVSPSHKAELSKTLVTLFHKQVTTVNKFAAMSIAEAELNFTQCCCKKICGGHYQRRRDADVARVLSAYKSTLHPSSKPKISRQTKSMPSFSPHGSSDSDSDAGEGKKTARKHSGKFTLLNSSKTVEEELSEEELTTEQMEDIIFLRKPVLTAPGSLRSKAPAVSSIHSRSKVNMLELHKSSSEPLFNSTPKIIPIEPVLESKSTPDKAALSDESQRAGKSTTEGIRKPVPDTKPTQRIETSISKENFVPKSILKNSSGKSVTRDAPLKNTIGWNINHEVKVKATSGQNNDHEVAVKHTSGSTTNIDVKLKNSASLNNDLPIGQNIALKNPVGESTDLDNVQNNTIGQNSSCDVLPSVSVSEDCEDVDMRIPMQGPITLHPVFLSARHPPSLGAHQLSPNFSLGSWLTPSEIQNSTGMLPPLSPPSPGSPPLDSPPSPTDSPMSPSLESPASPEVSQATFADTESPASPPQSQYSLGYFSSPIAIPTSRIQCSVSPDVFPKERIDSANDMKNFLNANFDSDFDSSYEDER